MVRELKVKLVKNKANGQFNLSIPKKRLPKDFLDKINKKMEVKIKW